MLLSMTSVNKFYNGNQILKNVNLTVNEGDSIVSWKSSDSKVASVSKDGVVTPHRPGNVTIKVRTESGLVKECHVKVKVVQLD